MDGNGPSNSSMKDDSDILEERRLVIDDDPMESEEDKLLRRVYNYVVNNPTEVSKQVLTFLTTDPGVTSEFDKIASQILNDFWEERKQAASRIDQQSSSSQELSKESSTAQTTNKQPSSSSACVERKVSQDDDEEVIDLDSPNSQFDEPISSDAITIKKLNIKFPPRGNFEAPSIKIGDQVLAAESDTAESLWTNALVKDITKKTLSYPCYRLQFLQLNRALNRDNVPASRVAFISRPKVMLKVGTHVVAFAFAGMIAETPKVTNGGQYLVFFEKGDPMYASPEEVTVVSDVIFKPDKDKLKKDYADFLTSYVSMYPERKMLKLMKGEQVSIRSLSTGKWMDGVVTDTQYSLVRVHFPSTDHYEWVYRGSHRLRALLHAYSPKKTLPLSESSSSQGSHTGRPGSQASSTGQQVVRRAVRSTASSSVLQKIQRKPVQQYVVQYVLDDDEENGETITGEVESKQEHKGDILITFLKHGQITRKPSKYTPHECSSSCLPKQSPDFATQLRGHNPFIWPILSGWSRLLTGLGYSTVGKKEVVYRSPCGRLLRNINEVISYLSLTGFMFSNECNLGIELFSFEAEVEFFRHSIAVVHPCVTYNDDFSNGQEKQPISLINFLDDEEIDSEFEYCSQRFPGPGVALNLDPNFLICCDCTDNCSNPATCACQQLTLQGFDIIEGMAQAYPVKGYKNKRLEEQIPFGIYECNSQCRCKINCGNRVVSNGITILLQVFKTSKKGWGTRVLHDIPKGTFIASYSAQIFNEDHADDNATTDEYFANLDFIECAEKNKAEYEDAPLVDLDSEEEDEDEEFRFDADDMIRLSNQSFSTNPSRGLRNQRQRLETRHQTDSSVSKPKDSQHRVSLRSLFGEQDNCYILDAKKKGNVGRFFNHSCSPNCFAQNVFTDTHDLRFPMVAFFASRTIYALEEITWDYQYEIDSVPDKKMYCYCKSANCRGRLL